MGTLHTTTEPGAVGLDADRLTRITSHFRGYVDRELLPGWQIAIARHGEMAFVDSYGHRDVEADLPVADDTIFRIYSMTKPIASVALMMLWEQGLFELRDPVQRYLPEFADTPVYVHGSALSPVVEPQRRPIEIWHLLTHTSGLTYGFHNASAVDQMYRTNGFDIALKPGDDLAAAVEALAAIPLLFQPGTEWNYSMSTDVVGRLVEVLSGQPLDEYLQQHLFGPLGMVDTGFFCPPEKHDRMAALYVPAPSTRTRVRMDAMGAEALAPPPWLSGGGGLVSTTSDYLRFAAMLAGGGTLDGVTILGPRTLGLMTSNHLPGGVDLRAYGRPLFAETAFDGVGFGLLGSVVIDPAATKSARALGEFGWGGLASTFFWIDPVDDIHGVFMTQLVPSSTHPIRTQLLQLLAQAITG